MMNEFLYKGILVNVNKIVVSPGLEERYIGFAKRLDHSLKERFGEYYICNQLNQMRDCSNVFYVEAFYYNVVGVYEAYSRIGRIVEQSYYEEFDTSVTRTQLTSFASTHLV